MNKFKQAFKSFTDKFDEQVQNPGESTSHHHNYDSSASNRRLAWPPVLTCAPNVLGETYDVSGRRYPRDIGRSVQLGGHTYYIYGDTFCFDASDQFCGVTNNCIARVPSTHEPLKSQWLVDEAKVAEFIPLSAEEDDYCKRHTAKGENKRYVNWSFGGIIDIPGSEGREGWLFFDPVEIHEATPIKQTGVGVARARVTDLETGAIECERAGTYPLFDADGPLWGNMSNISAPDGYTYLLSGRELDNFMARIRTDADFTDPSNYTFLKKGGEWVSSYSGPHGPFGELAHDVLHGQGQGAIVYVPEHGPSGKPYMWFGCEKFMTSKLWVGAAERPEGPWELLEVCEMPKIMGDQSKTRYCIYPHLWGSDLAEGKILISWSDDGTMGGKVAMGHFHFATI